MAKDKNSFLMYRDTIHSVELLSDEEAGKLFKHILQYVNDLNPKIDDRAVLIAFEPIKQYLKRDLQKYEKIVLKRAEAGRKSVQARLKKQKEEEAKRTNAKSDKQTEANSTVSDIDSVSDSDSDSDSVIVSVNDIQIEVNKNKFSSDEVFQTFDRLKEFFEKKHLPRTTTGLLKWLQEIDKLHRIDKHSFDRIVQVVKWAKSDSFWKTNFFTVLKLRKTNQEGIKYFDVFEAKMKPSNSDNFEVKDAENADDFFKS